MANTLLTPDLIARQALATLYESMVMLPLVYTDLSTEFTTQKIGDTVNVRKPAVFEAKDFDRARGIELQDAVESSIPVKLDKIADVSFAVTTEQLTQEITDFNTQLLAPAMMALAQKIDREILAMRNGITQQAGLSNQPGVTNPADFAWNKPEVLIEAGRQLDVNNVPSDQRVVITGPTTKAHWLNSPLLKTANQSGTTDALRRASLGNGLFGFDAYQTQNVGQPKVSPAVGDPTTEVGLAFHKSALAFTSAPLEVAPGSFAAVETYRGVSIRVAYQYSIDKKQTVVSLDTLYGTKVLDPKRAVLIKGDNHA
ncbi:P22 phage major capsid protein family protein [Prescottella equi]|uniref:P22 phage major capsid protein family protein n=1 Tax=Rhodococcus hoagii TaxID=43767 RepID=UPI000D110D36|nr:P22 phage major capsid protein family protein [Prescottella equi]AVP71362.1 hypothetical protein C7H75_25095 [Prescottella equi]